MFNLVYRKTDLGGRKHGVFIQTEHSISGDGTVGKKPTADHLVSCVQHKEKRDITVQSENVQP